MNDSSSTSTKINNDTTSSSISNIPSNIGLTPAPDNIGIAHDHLIKFMKQYADTIWEIQQMKQLDMDKVCTSRHLINQ